jgi:hypothetical protein
VTITLLFAFLATLIIVSAMWWAIDQTGDSVHPAIYLGPMFWYWFVLKPFALELGGWRPLLLTDQQLLFVQAFNLAGIGLFFLGTLWHSSRAYAPGATQIERGHLLSAENRRRAATLGGMVGMVAVLCFWLGVVAAGGIFSVYGQAKGGVYFSTGYLGDAPLLTFAAIGLLALAWQNSGLTFWRVMALLWFASPILIHGILGARRGPTFMIVMALFFAVHMIYGRKPRLIVVIVTLGCVGLVMIWLVNNRGRIYLGSSWESPIDRTEVVYADRGGVGTGEDWAYASGLLLTSREFGTHMWGWRYVAQLLVQPIPHQIWPNKYEDVGLAWLSDQGAAGGMTENEWRAAVGWLPATGAAGGVICDFFMEFSYVGLLACFAFGWLYAFLWRKAGTTGGVWSALYLFAVVLSIYVPTQNFNAWYYRFFVMSVPTIVIWRLYLAESPTSQPAPLPLTLPQRFARPARPH